MNVKDRRQKIFELVNAFGYISTEKLTSEFKVTPQTLRCDLNALADAGHLVRHHGGASISSSVINTDYNSRRSDFAGVKLNLGKAVAASVTDRSSIFLSLGTTMIAVAKALCVRSGLKIITNNLEAAQLLAKQPSFEVIVLGGRLEPRNLGTSGPIAMETVIGYRPDFCIFSVGGVHQDGLLLDYYENEATIVRAMINVSRKKILVVDHSKFSKSASVLVSDFTDVDQLFTDKIPSPQFKKILTKKKTQLMKISI